MQGKSEDPTTHDPSPDTSRPGGRETAKGHTSQVAADPSIVKYDAKGLVPCIVQDWNTGQVLMLAYMDAESLRRTLETGTTWFYSRSRQEYWNKGATSGHFQTVRELRYDCDADTLLVLVEQAGVACHTGDYSCFDGRWLSSPPEDRPPFLASRER